MIDIEDIRKKRFQFLSALYKETDGYPFTMHLTIADIGEKSGIGSTDAEKIAQYLDDERLIEIMDKDRHIRILHGGVKEVEDALSQPDKPTKHFPPMNVIYVEQMYDSQFAQGPGATMYIVTAEDRRTIVKAISLLKEHLDEFDLPHEQKSDLQADAETIEAQMKSSKPKWTIIKESAASINEKLQPIATISTIALQVIQLLTMVHH